MAGVEKEIMSETVSAAVPQPAVSGRAGGSGREPVLTPVPAAGSSPAAAISGKERAWGGG